MGGMLNRVGVGLPVFLRIFPFVNPSELVLADLALAPRPAVPALGNGSISKHVIPRAKIAFSGKSVNDDMVLA